MRDEVTDNIHSSSLIGDPKEISTRWIWYWITCLYLVVHQRKPRRNHPPMLLPGYLAVIWQNRISPKPLILQREGGWSYYYFHNWTLQPFKDFLFFPAPINPALFALSFGFLPRFDIRCIEKSIRSLFFDFHHVPSKIFHKPGRWPPTCRMSGTDNWKSSFEALLANLYTKPSRMIDLIYPTWTIIAQTNWNCYSST